MRDQLEQDLQIGVSILEPILAWVGLIASICIGAGWTAQAVLAGDGLGVAARFSVAVVFGFYYLVLIERSRRR